MNRTGESIKYQLDHVNYQIWPNNIMHRATRKHISMIYTLECCYLKNAIYRFGIVWNLDDTVISQLL